MLIDTYPNLQSARGFLIFGTPPIQAANHPVELSHYSHPSFPLAFTGTLTPDQVNELAAAMIKKGGEIPGNFYFWKFTK